jgi:uncharacterized Zn finger protein
MSSAEHLALETYQQRRTLGTRNVSAAQDNWHLGSTDKRNDICDILVQIGIKEIPNDLDETKSQQSVPDIIFAHKNPFAQCYQLLALFHSLLGLVAR